MIFRRWAGCAAVIFCLASVAVLGAEYKGDDFGRVVKIHPVVVAGDIHPAASNWVGLAGCISVRRVLKNGLIMNPTIKKGDQIALGATSNNTFWARAIVEYGKGQVGVWILDAKATDGLLEMVEIATHFAMEESTLVDIPAGQKEMPLEHWVVTDPAGSRWATVKVPDAAAYTLKGKFVGTLKAGATLNILRTTNSAAGEVVVGLPETPLDDEEREVLILLKDVNLLPGQLSKVAPRRRELCVREAELQAKLRTMWYELAGKSKTGNPFAVEYQAAKAAYDRYWAKVRDLQAKRDKGDGAARIKYADELRGMKGEDVRVGLAFEAARKKHESWQSPGGKREITSPEMEAMKKELAGVRDQIRQLAQD